MSFVTRFENELGGRVAIFGVTLCDEDTDAENLSQSLYNYRRGAMMNDLVEWCGGDYALVSGASNVFTVMNEAKDSESSGFLGIVTLVNLGEGAKSEITLKLPKAWSKMTSIKILDLSGNWISQSFEEAGDRMIKIKQTLFFGEGLILKII